MDSRASEVQASKHVNRFEGMSTLRAKEREAQPKSEQATAMDKYLLKYGDSKQTGDLRPLPYDAFFGKSKR